MHTRGRRLRFTAVLALTVLTLTGFSTGRHHSSSRHRSGGGGGCSSSSQDHDTSTNRRSNYRSTPAATASSGSGTSSLQDGTAKLVSCATATRQYATVEITNPNDRKVTFSVDVTFEDAQDNEVDYNDANVKVPANSKATVRVRFLGSSTPVDHCVVDRRATAVS
ncbi:hypothetical protein [Streptomyces hokutonensis]|uniref:hypothetical protein n=1 Tax=Streptomyces hokutonensis TaxID=1306990 RepID=UPI00382D19D5